MDRRRFRGLRGQLHVPCSERAALIGGYGPEYDPITSMQLTPAGIIRDGAESPLVRPDGLEVPLSRAFCRGPDLSLFPRRATTWYRLGVDDILS